MCLSIWLLNGLGDDAEDTSDWAVWAPKLATADICPQVPRGTCAKGLPPKGCLRDFVKGLLAIGGNCVPM